MEIKFTKRLYYAPTLTAEDFRHLCEIEWFAHLGETSDLTKVEAADKVMSMEWEEFTLARNNDMTRPLFTSHRDAFGEWNVISKGYHAFLKEAVFPRMFKAIQKQGIKESVASKLRWTLLAYMQEETYASFGIPRFYQMIIESFQRGHLPCGWEGEYPEGKLIML